MKLSGVSVSGNDQANNVKPILYTCVLFSHYNKLYELTLNLTEWFVFETSDRHNPGVLAFPDVHWQYLALTNMFGCCIFHIVIVSIFMQEEI